MPDQPQWLRRWPIAVPPGSAEAYALATIFIVLASLVRWALGFITPEILPFATFYPAVMFAALVGGGGSGVFASVLAILIGWWAFMPPYLTYGPVTIGQAVGIAISFISDLLLVWGAVHYRGLKKSLKTEESLRELAVRELGHRLKNKIATIQAIISFQLREHPGLRRAVLDRLTALSATDDLIMTAQGQGAYIHDILATEIKPYEAARVSTQGPPQLLDPKCAITMALLLHELITNAVKYGALSNATGYLTIAWTVSDSQLKLDWREAGGPLVTPPTRQGFGMLLLSRGLDAFGGTVAMDFDSTGLVCRLSLPLPENEAPRPVLPNLAEGSAPL